MLEKDLAETLGDASVDLPLNHHWVEYRSDVLDRHIIDQRGESGLRVDLDLAYVATVGIGGSVGRCEMTRAFEQHRCGRPLAHPRTQ